MTVKITRLLAVDDNSEVSSWLGDPEHLIFQEALDVLADWTGVGADAIEFCGEMFFANGDPVAFFAPPMFRRAA